MPPPRSPSITRRDFLIAMAATSAAGALPRQHALAAQSRRRWLLSVAAVEAAVMLVATVIALGYDRTTLEPVTALYATIVLTALAMWLHLFQVGGDLT